MAKRDGGTELAMMLVIFTMCLPIIIIAYLIKGIIVLIKFISAKTAKREEGKIYKKLLKTDIYEQLTQIDNLDGWEFEKYIGELLKLTGFKNVIITKGSGDFGADIVAEKENDKYAFQCKRFSSNIGPKPIGEVLRGMNKYKCNKGVVITNNYFTKQAIQEAKVSNIELWDRDKLSMLIRNNKNYIILDDDNSKEKEIEKNKKGKENNSDKDITNIKKFDLTAGYYEVDDDIEAGKYVIEAIMGDGLLYVQDKDNNEKVNEHIGKNVEYSTNCITKYNNLRLQLGDVIQIESNVTLRFNKIS